MLLQVWKSINKMKKKDLGKRLKEVESWWFDIFLTGNEEESDCDIQRIIWTLGVGKRFGNRGKER